MKGISTYAKLLAVLLVAGCGAATRQATTAPAAPQSVQAAGDRAEVRSQPVQISSAWARLSVVPGIVRPGGRASCHLDVWSDDKRIRSYDVRWYATDGHLDRWITRDHGYNGWWAPFSSYTRTVLIQGRVTVEFEDNTTASGTVGVNVWVNR